MSSISIQKSFLIKNKSLFLVATPIGNLKEMTPRAIEVLSSSDLIICENSLFCHRILSHFQIKCKRVITYDNIKEKSEFKISKVIKEMTTYEKISLISNAGYPLVSDPGRSLVRKWVDMGYYAIPVSGSSAFLNAIISSGFYYHNFTFLGFLPRNRSKQKVLLNVYSNNFISALIIYETANRLTKTLANIKTFLGNRLVAVCRELTKIHEEFIRASIDEVITHLESNQISLKGEVVIVVSVETKGHRFERISSLIKARKSKLKQM